MTIAWQGGEPTLMGLDFFRRSVELAERYLQPGQRAEHTIQTNGTLLDEEWAAFFREHGFLVGISIDGPRELHDVFRVNKGGKGSFDEVVRGLGHLRDAGVEWNVIDDDPCCQRRPRPARCTASCATSAARASSSSSRSSSASRRPTRRRAVPWTSWRDRPLYVQEGDHVTGRSVTAEQYGRFLIDVFEEWVRRDVGEVYVQMFDVALANWVGEPPACASTRRRAGSRSRSSTRATSTRATTSSSRDSGSGTSARRTCSSSSRRSSSASSAWTSATPCPATASSATSASPATAAARRTASSPTPDGEPGLNYLCAGYKAFFHHVDPAMRFMAEQLRRGGAPSAIVRVYREEDARRGRNDPCTCGSGRKWKHCHGSG